MRIFATPRAGTLPTSLPSPPCPAPPAHLDEGVVLDGVAAAGGDVLRAAVLHVV
jgi:hypothetical protein